VWSDPDSAATQFLVSARGCGYQFGPTHVTAFLRASKCSHLLRAHECVGHGLTFFAHSLGVTIFSSSNYGGRGNRAGFLLVTSENRMEPKQFSPLENLPTLADAVFEDVQEEVKTQRLQRAGPCGSLTMISALTSFSALPVGGSRTVLPRFATRQKVNDALPARRTALKTISGAASTVPRAPRLI
jgi:hypothetical protein